MSDDQDLEKCMEKASNAFNSAMEMLNDLSGWEEVDASPAVTIYKRPTDFGFNACKVNGYVNKPVTQVTQYIRDNWLDLEATLGSMDTVKDIRSFSDGSKIRYEKSPAYGIVSQRECWVFSSFQQIDEETWAILETSSPLEYEGTQGCVNGDLKFRIQVYAPIAGDATKTQISVSEVIDPKGSIPNFIINQISTEKGQFWKKVVDKLQTI